MERLSDDPESLVRFTYSLDNYKKALTVRRYRVAQKEWARNQLCTLRSHICNAPDEQFPPFSW